MIDKSCPGGEPQGVIEVGRGLSGPRLRARCPSCGRVASVFHGRLRAHSPTVQMVSMPSPAEAQNENEYKGALRRQRGLE